MLFRLRSWWQTLQQHPAVAIGLVVAGILGIALVMVVVLGYWLNWDWTGLGPYTPPAKESNFQRSKTLWDWMQLLIIPLVLAIGGFVFSQVQKNNEQKTTADNQREVALQDYIDKLSELLLREKLRESAENDEVRKIARARTLTVLPRLDGKRKRSVLQFLHEAGLIDRGKPIIDLKGSDLSYAGLWRADLAEADLSYADLWRADLVEAKLSDANLMGADLRGANLKRATVEPEQLAKAKSLRGATMPDGSKHPG